MVESELRKAIKNEELFILYQPKIDLSNYELVGIEALIRWKHPYLGLISPMEFIPIAEETGLIIDIGNWIIQEVCSQIK
jgi:EAL domain-containing protein (putative c-di-GMP-specific phosphodiesterase class I)